MTELIWDGKYVDGKQQGPVRLSLPFQNVETINESAPDRQRSLEFFAKGHDADWRNRLIWGDKKYVLPALIQELAGEVDLIYIDPPFDTGADFSFTANIPSYPAEDDDVTSFGKQPSIIEQKAYRDTWGRGLSSYLQWFSDAAVLLRDLLAPTGALYVQLDSNVVHYAKVVLDEVFGPEAFRAEIIWKRATKLTNLRNYGIEHDTILFYTKSGEFAFNQQYKPLKERDVLSKYIYLERPDGEIVTLSKAQRLGTEESPPGRRLRGVPLTNMNPNRPNLKYEFRGHVRVWAVSEEKMLALDKSGKVFQPTPGALPMKKQYLDEVEGAKTNDVWDDIPPVNSQAIERTGYATQKPEALLERIIRTSSASGDLVLDCFVGSGTTAAVCEKLGRRWIGCDLGRFAIHTTRKRLLEIPGIRPFVVQNLGKYERQLWQKAEFPATGDDPYDEQRAREASYRAFILDLYRAEPVTGHMWLHGVRSNRMVHIGAVDAPVTQEDVRAIARETWKVLGADGGNGRPLKAGVDILGWDFALEVNEITRQIAAESRVDVSFKKIPREVLDKRAVQQGDIRFFELGALSLETKAKGREVKIALDDFAIPVDDIPESARAAIKHWSQLIDYWAIDWDYRDDTFHNQWQTYRTRRKPSIDLTATHAYESAGSYVVVVKVIDILGNDTTKALEINIK